MSRKFFQRFMPSKEKVHADKSLKWLSPILNKPYLWHLNRHSVSRAVALGIAWALIPIPLQSIPAVYTTIKARGNVPLALAATWVSNPFTLVPHWWSAYLIGKFILRSPPSDVQFTWEYFKPHVNGVVPLFHFVTSNFVSFYMPLFVGSVIEGIVLGGIGYLLVNGLWKAHTRKKWKQSRIKARRLQIAPAL